MEISFRLCLPREEATVPVARHLCRLALKELGVVDECSRDICGALTEACANVLHHGSDPGDDYEVEVQINPRVCVLRVIDSGCGFDNMVERAEVEPTAERGRGIALMRALADAVRFESKPPKGTIVHLEKKLELQDDAPIKRMAPFTSNGHASGAPA
jgi:serine/threonine-protein kinase RsbW